jgi:PAS domain S-box-containing protein
MKKACILYVDDEASNLRTLKNSLRREYDVVTAATGKQGLEILSKNHVDVIITDQKMPDMSGVEFLKQALQKDPVPKRILLTGYSDFEALKDALNAGKIFQYIQKPWEKEILVHIIEQALQGNRLERDNVALKEKLIINNEKIKIINNKLKSEIKSKNETLKRLRQSQKEFEQNEIRLKEAEKIAKLGYWELKPHTQEMHWSEAVYDIFDMKPAKVPPVYKTFTDIVIEQDRPADSAAYKRHIKNRKPYEIELCIKLKNNSIKYILKKCHSKFNRKKQVLISFGTIQDITEKKQFEFKIKNYNEELEERIKIRTAELKEERNNAQKYLDIAGVFIMVIDINKKIRLINKNGMETLGYNDVKEIIGLNWYENFIPEDIRKTKINKFNQGINKRDPSYLLEQSPVITRHNETRILAWKNTLLFDKENHVSGVLRSGNDITESKNNEKIIKEYTEELEMFNSSMLGREMRIIELKEEINSLAKELGKNVPYPEIWEQ